MNGLPFRVGVVLSPRPWSGRLHGFVADHVQNIELIVVRDQRAAMEAGAHVLLIDASTPWLTPAFIGDAERADVRVVGVYDRTDGGVGRARLAGLGLTHLIEEAMPSEDVVFLLDRLRPVGGNESRLRPPPDVANAPAGRGDVVAVGGPSGSGARELAVGLARAWSDDGCSVLLVDVNETTPGIARRLGLGLYPHLLTAIERVRADGLNGIEAALADQVTRLPFDVIVGLATPRDWDRLVANDIDMLLDTCRDGWDRVVVTTSPLIEDLQRWGDRFGLSRRALVDADAAVGCCEPSPRGVLRYLDWIADVTALRPTVVTTLNKVPASTRVAAEASRQLRDVGGSLIEPILEVPFDRSVVAAEWDGVLTGGRSYRKAVAALATAVDTLLAEAVAVAS
jgi:hypothetical protein